MGTLLTIIGIILLVIFVVFIFLAIFAAKFIKRVYNEVTGKHQQSNRYRY